jgi:EAL domain-containing protein (putative c-di-GMP-specific phosphodiesterase class I)
MICLVTSNLELRKSLTRLFREHEIVFRALDPTSDLAIPSLYAAGVKGVVVDSDMPGLVDAAWLDLLGSLGRRIPVLIIGEKQSQEQSVSSRNSELFVWVPVDSPELILAMLDSCGASGRGARSVSLKRAPIYNPQVPLHMLQGSGAISMLLINASALRKILIEFGVEAYQKAQDCFHQILVEMWGQNGSFRNSDMLMRRSAHSNTYYVFLEQSRISKTVPAPGVLEKLADRVAMRIQEALWAEVFKDRNQRFLPDGMRLIPDFSVGHATALHNPCVDPVDLLDHLIDSATEVAKVHQRRVKDREREIMQTIIQSREILTPNYQGVFQLQGVTQEKLEQVKKSKSIAPIKDLIFGFESLIRARKNLVEEKLTGDHLVFMDFRLFRPDILFEMAGHAKVALELDQVCLGLGILHAVSLPGKLMVNILPRNLLHLERLTHLISPRGKIIFELSESEGVTNLSLMQKIHDYVSKIDCTIAADDFGKGHASIERVIKLRPELIKLDRSLVEKIHQDPTKAIFVEGIVKAAKQVNAIVLAEGIETWEEAQVVQQMGVDLIQGFLLHRPQSLEEILAQLQESEMQSVDSVA